MGIGFAEAAQANQCIEIFKKAENVKADVFELISNVRSGDPYLKASKITKLLNSFGAADAAIFLTRVLQTPAAGRTVAQNQLYFSGSSREFIKLFISQYQRFSGSDRAEFLKYYLESAEGLASFYSFRVSKDDLELFLRGLDEGSLSLANIEYLINSGNLGAFARVSPDLITRVLLVGDRENFPFVLRLIENESDLSRQLFIDAYGKLRLETWDRVALENFLETVSTLADLVYTNQLQLAQVTGFATVVAVYTGRNTLFKLTPELAREYFAEKLPELSQTVNAEQMEKFVQIFVDTAYKPSNANLFYKVFKADSMGEIFDLLLLSTHSVFTAETLQNYIDLRTQTPAQVEQSWWQKLTASPIKRGPLGHQEAIDLISR